MTRCQRLNVVLKVPSLAFSRSRSVYSMILLSRKVRKFGIVEHSELMMQDINNDDLVAEGQYKRICCNFTLRRRRSSFTVSFCCCDEKNGYTRTKTDMVGTQTIFCLHYQDFSDGFSLVQSYINPLPSTSLTDLFLVRSLHAGRIRESNGFLR